LVEEAEVIDGIIVVVVDKIGHIVPIVVDDNEKIFIIIVVVVVVVAVASLNRSWDRYWDGSDLRKKARISGMSVSQIFRIVLTRGWMVMSSCMYWHSCSQTQGNTGGQ